jgi:predicted nucleotidyltransferase component of viral defense system
METILAEKYETIIRRGVLNTKARDFYDVYTLANLYWEEFSNSEFKRALDATASKRGPVEKMSKSWSVLEELRLDNNIKKIWDAYSKKFDYANGIEFEDTLVSIEKLTTLLFRVVD